MDGMSEMDAQQAGAILREKRQKMGLSQKDVVTTTGIGCSMAYLSALEGGRYDVRHSKHFPTLAKFYGLTLNEIRQINPEAIIDVTTVHEIEYPIPVTLQQVAKTHRNLFPEFSDEKWLSELSRLHASRLGPDPEARDWLDLVLALKRFGFDPSL